MQNGREQSRPFLFGSGARCLKRHAGSADGCGMPVIGAAAAAEQLHARECPPERHITAAEIGGIAAVERLGLIELGMTLGRRIGPDAMNAFDPWLASFEGTLEMGRMSAVDQEIFAGAF